MKGFFYNIYIKLKIKFEKLTDKQKLIFSVIGLVILIFLVYLLSNISNSNNIDYKSLNGTYIYNFSNVISNNEFALVDEAASQIVSQFKGEKYFEMEKIEIDDIYKYEVLSEYKKYISKGKFSDCVNNFIEKYNRIYELKKEVVPSSISEYSENQYIVVYSAQTDEEDINCYLGVALNTEGNSYYIWYVE